jgi:hypothetical protein
VITTSNEFVARIAHIVHVDSFKLPKLGQTSAVLSVLVRIQHFRE